MTREEITAELIRRLHADPRTLREIAETMGLSPSVLRSIASGTDRPSPERMDAIADVLGMEIQWKLMRKKRVTKPQQSATT